MMAAVAHSLDDEPQPDSAEEPMSAADFRIIERAHQLCGHSPARELPAELEQRDCLIVRATKILGAQIRARELVHEMKQRGDFDLNVSDLVETDSEESHWLTTKNKKFLDLSIGVSSLQLLAAPSTPDDVRQQAIDKECESSLGDDEPDEVVTDWAQIAADAWRSEGWARAAAEYQFERGKQRGVRR